MASQPSIDVSSVIATIRQTPDCVILPPAGLPETTEQHVLPNDVRTFYQLAGGATLFERSAYRISIVPPARVVVANPVIMLGVTTEQFNEVRDHPSWSWYVIGEGDSGQYITIDFAPERLGLCYDSYWDVHPQDSTIIATSFTELLIRLLACKGEGWYWGRPEFDLSRRPGLGTLDNTDLP